jgi:hypothetical protein
MQLERSSNAARMQLSAAEMQLECSLSAAECSWNATRMQLLENAA